jgi:hypothetical protein
MRAAIDRGDIDEAARQGMLAGPVVIERALAAPDRPARLAGIAAAPSAADREELLEPLAQVAASGDRRIAIPAAESARTIARELARRVDLPDDIARDDVATWRDAFGKLAADRDRFIEVRVRALETAAALDRIVTGTAGTGVDLSTALADPDPAYRRAAIGVVSAPVPQTLRAPLAAAVGKDIDPAVALAAAAALCADLAFDPPKPIVDALGTAGIDRIRALAAGAGSRALIREASRCLK